MEQVGYDTYCKLLDEVVKEMQGQQVEKDEEERDIQIDLNLTSYIPDSYIENSSQKIEIYQNIALCTSEEDVQNIIDELLDRYGEMPKEVENLIQVARIKMLCKQAHLIKLNQNKERAVFTFEGNDFNMEMVDNLMKKYKNKIKFSPAKDPYITYQLDITSGDKLVEEIKNMLADIVQYKGK